MKHYKTKSKMFGYKIGLNNDNLYIAIPKKYLKKDVVEVECGGEIKLYSLDDTIIEATQKDKYNGGMNYTLCYVLWKSF